MKKLAIVLLLLSSSALFAAVPFVGECDFVQDADSGVASVSFTLAEDAVVTFDVLTNGVSIGWRNFRSGISGCKLGEVNPAGDYELKWDVYGSWGVKQLPIRAGGIKAVVTAWSPDNPPQYMDVDLTRDGGIVYYIDEADLPHPVTSSVYKTTHLLLKRIYAGNKRWKMGSPATEKLRAKASTLWEEQRDVVLSADYYIGVFETTQKQWELFTGNTVPDFVFPKGDAYPIVGRSMQRLRGHQQDSSKLWPKAGHNFASENSDLGKLCAKAGRLFDLPTEAQWEYACRGGTVTAYNTGTNGDANGVIPDEELDKIAVYLSNSEIEIDGQVINAFREVGTKLSNAFGLYDTVGNVAEYCLDSRLNADLGAFDPRDNDLVDPVGGIMPPAAADARLVLRGSWYKCKNSQYNWEGLYGGDVNAHRSAYRGYGSSYFTHEPTDFAGFRIVSPTGRAWPEMNDDVMEESACQNPGLRTVKLKYNLDDNAIVTMKVRVDGKDFSGLSADVAGDINRMVDAGNGKTKIVSWNPDSTTEALESAADKVSVSLEKWSIENPPAYMAIELTDPSLTNIEYFAEGGVPGGATNVRYKTDWLLMRRIPAKNVVWWMGVATNSSGNSVEAVADDTKCAKRHLVKLDEDYFMSVFPMTERQWHWIAGTAPTNIATFTLPMLVDYNTVRPHRSSTYLWPKDGHSVYPECVLGRLRMRSGGYRFDLPTEAQWEYACRALTGSAYCDGNVSLSAANGNSAANLEPYGWHLGNSSGQIHHVGEKLFNGFGLYDMHGNVWEWVLDFYDTNYGLTEEEIFAAQTVPINNPQGKSGLAWSSNRALRGGSYAHDANRARSGSRGEGGYCAYIRNPGSTVRLVCPIVPMPE